MLGYLHTTVASDPDLLGKRLQAQQAYANKLQERYNSEAEEYKKKMEEVRPIFQNVLACFC